MSDIPYATLVSLIDAYWDNPVFFAEDMLGFYPDKEQAVIMMDVARHPKTTVRSGQGVGKTAVEAVLAIWFLCCRPNPRVVATAPTRQQLYDVLWPEIAKWLTSSKVERLLKWTKTKVYMIGNEERWFATAKTATRPENMQGFHEDYMLFIVDEASGVPDPIMEAILGTLTGQENKLLMCSNPTRLSGVFYDSHHKDRKFYKVHKISSRTSKRTNKENIVMLENKYGKDSDVVRVRVDGEFPKAEADAFIPLEIVELATSIQIEPIGNVLHIGVDVARFGDDETVIAPRIGGKCFDLKVYNKQDTMATVGWVLDTAKAMMKNRHQIKKAIIKVDDGGLGGGVTDRLNEVIKEQGLPYIIVPVNNQGKANDDHYDNLGTEVWATLRNFLEENCSGFIRGEKPIIELPNDEKLISQLSTRKYRMTSRGKIALESKDDMKKRGLQSPDRADAVTLAFYEPDMRILDPASVGLLRGVKVYG
jgi:phage terminase large subunit